MFLDKKIFFEKKFFSHPGWPVGPGPGPAGLGPAPGVPGGPKGVLEVPLGLLTVLKHVNHTPKPPKSGVDRTPNPHLAKVMAKTRFLAVLPIFGPSRPGPCPVPHHSQPNRKMPRTPLL